MCGIYAGEDISDIERFIIFIFLLCYYYTGIDKQILNHSISFPHKERTPGNAGVFLRCIIFEFGILYISIP